MSKKHAFNTEDLLALFEEVLNPSDVLSSKLISQISTAITKERIKRNMSQKDFAKIFDVSQAIISRWEHGDCNFSLEKIAEIAVALDLDVNIYFSDVKSIKKRVAPFVRTIQSETFLTKAPSEKQYTPDVSVHNIISTSKEETSYASVC